MQIRFFYPELDHPAFGVVRAIAKDDTDTETGAAATVFLDSDNTARPLLLLTCHFLRSPLTGAQSLLYRLWPGILKKLSLLPRQEPMQPKKA